MEKTQNISTKIRNKTGISVFPILVNIVLDVVAMAIPVEMKRIKTRKEEDSMSLFADRILYIKTLLENFSM